MALVFQYGSNMSSERLNHKDWLAGDAKVIDTVSTIDKFELGFTVWSKNNQCAAADLLPSPNGRSIYGVVYDIPDFLLSRNSAKKHGRKSLDAIEGEGNNYIRRTIKLIDSKGSKINAITYVVKNPKGGLKTATHYIQHILNGIEEHNIPADYKRYVLSKIFLNNPEIKQEIDE